MTPIAQKLVWVDRGNHGSDADHSFGFYEVYPDFGKYRLSRDGVDSGVYSTIELARAAAQSDYASRITAALDPAWLARMDALGTAADGLAVAVEGWRDTSIGIGQAIANVELKLQAFRAAQEAANG